MSRWNIEVDGRRFEVEVEDRDADRYRVVVDGREHEVSLASLDEPDAAAAEAGAATSAAAAPRARASRPSRTAAPSADVLGAPMPGLMLRILVAPGAHVKRGQDLAVLEAMKMENLIRAPRDGVIAEICARQGQQLAHGDAVIRFEPSS